MGLRVGGLPPGKAKAALSGLRRVEAAAWQSHLNGQRDGGARIQAMALGELCPAADPRPSGGDTGVIGGRMALLQSCPSQIPAPSAAGLGGFFVDII